ncbi:DUF6457 domain-containing protein [Streptomyces chilikensis]|uniref:DUF6457 domain-containing protein n=1 Tax=Streptomyces chilikensis TaxID=1194079 RepID=UPI001F0F1F3D|nr:DUF6457 domain-containing protein [Streptomyces chilikensis]
MTDHESSPAVRGAGHHGYDAVVLAGGAARRLGGADKPGVRVGGRALLDRVLAACAGAGRTVVVADPRPTARPVRWAREEPPGGGPLAALAAGLEHTTAASVVVLSADLPFLGHETVARLVTTLARGRAQSRTRPPAPSVADPAPLPSAETPAPVPALLLSAETPAPAPRPDPVPAAPPDAVLVVDAAGRWQPLVAAYRAEPLRKVLAEVAGANGGLTGLPLRRLTEALRVTLITDPAASFDCDTWEDIDAARARIREHEHVLDEWITAAKDELGIDLDVDRALLLDLARDAAHGVARPAAPLTTFLVGYAAGRAGGGPEAVAEAVRKAVDLARRWAEESAAEPSAAGATDAG